MACNKYIVVLLNWHRFISSYYISLNGWRYVMCDVHYIIFQVRGGHLSLSVHT